MSTPKYTTSDRDNDLRLIAAELPALHADATEASDAYVQHLVASIRASLHAQGRDPDEHADAARRSDALESNRERMQARSARYFVPAEKLSSRVDCDQHYAQRGEQRDDSDREIGAPDDHAVRLRACADKYQQAYQREAAARRAEHGGE